MRSTRTENTTLQGQIAPPALSDLGLTAGELQALRTQGTVRSQLRGRQTWVYELRFRTGTRQCRRYLGTNPDLAEAVNLALQKWQEGHQTMVRLRRASREVTRLVKASKTRLLVPLANAGYKFHGRTIRRSRTHFVRHNQNHINQN